MVEREAAFHPTHRDAAHARIARAEAD